MDETQLRSLLAGLERRQKVGDRRGAIMDSLVKAQLLTPSLTQALNAATSLAELEDIYLPLRPKRTTRASAAVDKGLQDLALVMMGRYLCVKERERARACSCACGCACVCVSVCVRVKYACTHTHMTHTFPQVPGRTHRAASRRESIPEWPSLASSRSRRDGTALSYAPHPRWWHAIGGAERARCAGGRAGHRSTDMGRGGAGAEEGEGSALSAAIGSLFLVY